MGRGGTDVTSYGEADNHSYLPMGFPEIRVTCPETGIPRRYIRSGFSIAGIDGKSGWKPAESYSLYTGGWFAASGRELA